MPDRDWADDLDDDDDDIDTDDDESETLDCPQCGAAVFEDSVQCPVCGHYITWGANPWSGRPWWWVMAGLLGILAVLGTLLLVSPF